MLASVQVAESQLCCMQEGYLGRVTAQLLCNVSNLAGEATAAALLEFSVLSDLFVQPEAVVIT